MENTQAGTQAGRAPIDVNRAAALTGDVSATLDDMFEYHEWNQTQAENGRQVRQALVQAAKTIIDCVPPSPDRTVALRKLREARMDANSAITHGGKY
jgi:hypothetical protein